MVFEFIELNRSSIFAAKSLKYTTANLIHSFYQNVKSTYIENHFSEMILLPATSALKVQLKMTHKQTGIVCVLISDDISLVKATKIIQIYITIEPMCKKASKEYFNTSHELDIFLIELYLFPLIILGSYLTAVIKTIQLHTKCFNFNSYIITILVIFFLQVKHQLPTSLRRNHFDAKARTKKMFEFEEVSILMELVPEFFDFYANKYQMESQIICSQLGRWQTPIDSKPNCRKTSNPSQKE